MPDSKCRTRANFQEAVRSLRLGAQLIIIYSTFRRILLSSWAPIDNDEHTDYGMETAEKPSPITNRSVELPDKKLASVGSGHIMCPGW
jgi:hypothetical protein